MGDEKNSPMFWFVVCAIPSAAISFFVKGLDEGMFLAGLTSLAYGFFFGSFAYSIVSLKRVSHVDSNRSMMKLVGASLLCGAVGGAFYFLNGDVSKGFEIGAIVSGLGALALGQIFEERIQKSS